MVQGHSPKIMLSSSAGLVQLFPRTSEWLVLPGLHYWAGEQKVGPPHDSWLYRSCSLGPLYTRTKTCQFLHTDFLLSTSTKPTLPLLGITASPLRPPSVALNYTSIRDSENTTSSIYPATPKAGLDALHKSACPFAARYSRAWAPAPCFRNPNPNEPTHGLAMRRSCQD
jgi:hypothetical protein